MIRTIGWCFVILSLMLAGLTAYCAWLAVPSTEPPTDVAGAVFRLVGWSLVSIINGWASLQLLCIGMVAITDDIYRGNG